MHITIADARALVEAAMAAVGYDAAEAAIVADHLVDCELRGLGYGGLARALSVVERIRNTTTPRRPITVLQETPSTACLDGGDTVGHVVGLRATELALAKARQTGLAAVGASKTWYTGMYSYYLERITAAGFAGMIAGSGTQIVAPHGGTEGRFGTNPIAFGFPTAAAPVIWDIGTADVMIGDVALKARLGEPLPAGQAFDASGQPTCDAAAALRGAFTVWGGHKGSGLAMMVQILAMMVGQVPSPAPQRDSGIFVLVVNPALFTSADEFRQRAAEYVQRVRDTRPLDPARPVRAPFDRSREERARRLAAGTIEVADKVVAGLRREAGIAG
ncbi:MAG: Ldh family oxidoreductase [Burkholderiales bacterium]|nr:Ldh family oxidoreductase [Burkholderiales bacterium]